MYIYVYVYIYIYIYVLRFFCLVIRPSNYLVLVMQVYADLFPMSEFVRLDLSRCGQAFAGSNAFCISPNPADPGQHSDLSR